MTTPKGKARRDRRAGLALVMLHGQDSAELSEVLAEFADVLDLRDAQYLAGFLACSRRTARRAATYARRLLEVPYVD